MKRVSIDAEFKNNQGETILVEIDFFFREVKIWRPGLDKVEGRAISAFSVNELCFDVTSNPDEMHDLVREVYNLMDHEGKHLLECLV